MALQGTNVRSFTLHLDHYQKTNNLVIRLNPSKLLLTSTKHAVLALFSECNPLGAIPLRQHEPNCF